MSIFAITLLGKKPQLPKGKATVHRMLGSNEPPKKTKPKNGQLSDREIIKLGILAEVEKGRALRPYKHAYAIRRNRDLVGKAFRELADEGKIKRLRNSRVSPWIKP